MKRLLPVVLLAALGMLSACKKPVPPEKSDYVGEWQDKSMYLLILQGGTVQYRRSKDSGTVEFDGPIKDFIGNDIEVGVGPMATTFVVSKPPYQQGEDWKMVVDNVELTKTAD